ncbi:glutamate ABC transporter substrate-binding protein [Corynebacterium casei]|uniref:glutamate ABC transporter substrate-binding protein n=1 Tax=Corynebacterium casei TaxID=160386 RepID=UPI002648F89D|nr:glutamate ABC transporter substrate-binding protein [Corynebacterium casei]MDN5706885.1 glutamate ABC transporter substrate-binding protein [Corynebacterium casei]MDN5729688.1 glutamate ABC transporter substrate-binding protein [Corynebacterium casei]MDN5741249.1 glutamate ABC transporter substrate-binding protein [Corynebacterium casei]MDN5784226.1 glutamate ABC transporter substrate-binding protein [Corynebacterium casei]MDN5841466.1 glutamate ABC transporter substrate-binding protein [Co
MSKTKSAIALFAGAATLSLSACSSSDGSGDGLLGAIESGNVILGVKFDQPGIGLREGDGSFTGAESDIATKIVETLAEENGWDTPNIEYRETPAAQRETLLRNGEAHLIQGGYSITPDRMEIVDFAGPLLLTHQALLVRTDDSSIQSLDDLDGKILCSTTGSKPAQRIKEEIPAVQLQEYDTNSSCIEALSQGNVDALTSDAPILAGYAGQYDGDFEVLDMTKADGSFFSDEWYGIGLQKDDTEGVDAVNQALADMKESGELNAIIEEYFGDLDSIEETTPGDLSGI